MSKPVWLLPLFLGGTLSLTYLLPRVGAVAQSAVDMELPAESGGWSFEKQTPSPEELAALAKDTRFSKAICLSARPGEYSADGYKIPDRIDLSVVLSGSDVNNSIHRPERCMASQGHDILSSTDQTLTLANHRQVPTKRLVSIQSKNAARPGEKERYVKFNCLTYYFFVGHEQLTNDHIERTVMDMKDRLVRGMDQRWAYVSATMWYGKVPWIENEVSEKEADAKLQSFIEDFAEKRISWDQIVR